jgi:hypothetical protein
MGVGDLVRLKQSFRPTVNDLRAYDYGIVAGIVGDSSNPEVLIHLYNLQSATVYTDTFNSEAIFSFRLEEIDCCVSL